MGAPVHTIYDYFVSSCFLWQESRIAQFWQPQPQPELPFRRSCTIAAIAAAITAITTNRTQIVPLCIRSHVNISVQPLFTFGFFRSSRNVAAASISAAITIPAGLTLASGTSSAPS